jgi:hypothetical protein
MERLAPDRPSLVLSVNRALWGEVSCNLRSVYVECKDGEIKLYCYFDGEISEGDQESMSAAAAEVVSDFPDHTIEEYCIRADAPKRIAPMEGRHLVFKRKETEN